MTTFDSRERAFESKYAHDEELKFKIMARRNKLLGLWAAEIMGMDDAEAQSYAKDVIRSDFEEAGDEDVYRKVAKDLKDKNSSVDETTLRTKMVELLMEAERQIST